MFEGENPELAEDLMNRLLPPQLSDAELMSKMLASQTNIEDDASKSGSKDILEVVFSRKNVPVYWFDSC